MMTVNEISTKCAETFKKVNLEFKNIEVNINGRLTATLGRCCYIRICGKVAPTKIEISKKLLETGTPHMIEEVIKHECAHAIACIETGEKQGHNGYFKSVCKRIGTDNDTCACKTTERTVSDNKVYKYIVCCKCCGKVVGKYYRAGKVVKYPTNYTSTCCKAGLSVTQNY